MLNLRLQITFYEIRLATKQPNKRLSYTHHWVLFTYNSLFNNIPKLYISRNTLSKIFWLFINQWVKYRFKINLEITSFPYDCRYTGCYLQVKNCSSSSKCCPVARFSAVGCWNPWKIKARNWHMDCPGHAWQQQNLTSASLIKGGVPSQVLINVHLRQTMHLEKQTHL